MPGVTCEGPSGSFNVCLRMLAGILLFYCLVYIQKGGSGGSYTYYYRSPIELEYNSTTSTFFWITSREGLTSIFGQMERIHSHLLNQNRHLMIVNGPSLHFKDQRTICLCDIFVLPLSISCTDVPATSVVKAKQCIMPPIPIKFKHSAQNYTVQNFGLPESYSSLVGDASSFSWSTTKCALLFGWYFPLINRSHALKVEFQNIYVDYFEQAKVGLGLKKYNTNSSEDYLVAHWRRGDQKNKCKMKESLNRDFLTKDTSVNCRSAENFVAEVRQSIASSSSGTIRWNSSNPMLVYVATNERDAESLAVLRKAGFKLFCDTKLKGLKLLDIFVVELQLMIDATALLGWGPTGVREFAILNRKRKNLTA